jgi:hypothetical protein
MTVTDMTAAPNSFLSIFIPFFLLCDPASLPDHPTKHRLRRIDAEDRNELLAISRDRNVIDDGRNASMREPQGRHGKGHMDTSRRRQDGRPQEKETWRATTGALIVVGNLVEE